MMTSPGLALYRGGTTLLSPLARIFLKARARHNKEDATRLDERLGRAQCARPHGDLIWLHGASIGEGLALLPLIGALQARGTISLLTTGTRASAEVLGNRLPNGALHQFVPLDLPDAIGAFLDHWRPRMLVLAESELWPNMLMSCHARRIPVVIVNGRLSSASHARWRRVPSLARALFGAPAFVLAQSDEHAARFSELGARDVRVIGNLKHDRAPPPVDLGTLAQFRALVGTRPVVVAVSTHAADEPIILHAIAQIRAKHRDLLTVIVPRDASRGMAVAAAAHETGLAVALRSRGDTASPQIDALLGDTFGEMGLWLRLASVAMIGKTFGGGGGQTPIEAAQCGAAIVHGPSVAAFADVFAALGRAGGALCVPDGDALAAAVDALLSNPAHRRAMARAASATVDELRGATARTVQALEPFLANAQDVAA